MPHSDLLHELDGIISESRNPATTGLDLLPTSELLGVMAREDLRVPRAVAKELPAIEQAVDRIARAFMEGGRLIYIGAGTSGRLGVLDASECQPTFSVPVGMVIGLIAGGDHALRNPIEGAEDDSEQGASDLLSVELTSKDVVVGIAVSGRTPYVLGAMDAAKTVGATTIGLSCNPGSPLATSTDIAISPVVGPEIITGSTRLKSGSAQKLVLNMLTTASMVRMGKVYDNLMVDLSASNEKLRARAIRIVMEVTGLGEEHARQALAGANGDLKLAILMSKSGVEMATGQDLLTQTNGNLREALARVQS